MNSCLQVLSPLAMLCLATAPWSAASADDARLAEDSLGSTPADADAFDGGSGWSEPWIRSSVRPALLQPDDGGVLIRGTGDRNNPLRRELTAPFRGDELFVRFQFRYDPPEDDSEFFVLWLDRLDSGDRATHSANVPNIGIHVAESGPMKGKTVFMVRIGPAKTAWTRVELKRGRDYSVVGRLSKSKHGQRADFDRFEIWVDPDKGDRSDPDAAIQHSQSVNFVRWVGFATGRKTEPADRLWVDDLLLSRTWEDVLDSMSPPVLAKTPPLPGHPWEGAVHFAKDVYPLLKSHCFECHSGDKPESGVRLDVRRELLGYSTGDPLAEPGRAHESHLLEKVTATNPDDRMPPPESGKQALTDREVGLIAAWIQEGMPWDETLLPTPRITSDHWAFQPVQRPAIPDSARSKWGRTPVDAFIAARQETAGITPAKEASASTLVRRLYLDLIGLPPSPHQVDAFVAAAKTDPDATYAELVDELLQSPHYGERWGRFWLDLARWGESHGYQHDIPRPYAWRYRDYVVNSFNADKPYDRFLAEQLAGDELKPYSDENLIATGFLAAARISGNNMAKAAQRNDVLLDIVNATGSAVMGLTMECAQCHNHKFDPITQRDYFRLQAFFVKGQLGNLTLRDPATPNPTDLENWMASSAYKFYMSEAKKLIKKDRFEHTEQPHTWGYHSPANSDPEIHRLPVVNRDPIAWDPESLKDTRARILVRGDITRPGPVVKSGWPEVLGPTPEAETEISRTAFAQWLSRRDNPLVSRVWANRIWQWHFGQGIVATTSNFGTQGAPPTHPELLDWLASELMENDWSTKHLHRQIVLSSTYRQERRHNGENANRDPGNTLLWNWPSRRLEAEAIRDAVLSTTGELDLVLGGPSIPPEREEGDLRRTLYLYQRRSDMPPAMTMFDSPELIASCPQRGVSTVALQPLYLLNSDFMMKRAEALAHQVYAMTGDAPDRQVMAAFRRVLGRAPSGTEKSRSVAMLTSESDSMAALTHFCHALINLNEFLYIP